MNIIDKTIDSKTMEFVDQLNTIAIAKITQVDNKKLMCSIKLLDKIEMFGIRSEVSEIENVPILPLQWNKNMKSSGVFNVGDKVIVLFCQHSTFNARNSDNPIEADHLEKYSLNNAIVLGHIKKDSETNEYSNSWYIQHKNSLLEIQEDKVIIESKDIELKVKSTLKINSNGVNLKENKSIDINTPKLEIVANNGFKLTAPNIEFNGNLKVNGNIKANDIGITNEPSLNGHIIKYKTHTHTSTAPGTPTSPPTI